MSYGMALTNTLGTSEDPLPPVAVGYVSVQRCGKGEEGPVGDVRWGFSVPIPASGPPATLYALKPVGSYSVGESQDSFGLEVNSTVRAVGDEQGRVPSGPFFGECDRTPGWTDCSVGAPGDNPAEPVAWDADPSPSGPTPMDQIVNGSGFDFGAHTIGNNDVDNAVGWGRETDENLLCARKATYWPTTSLLETPFILGHTMPISQGDNESAAFAINEPDQDECASVVGTDITGQLGLIWHGDGSTFCVENLQDITYVCGSPGDVEIIVDAHDINDNRFIVAVMRWEDEHTNVEFHAVLITSAGDISGSSTGVGDLVVDGADLGIVLSDWGLSSSAFAPLSGDINCDGTVDGADSGIVLANWLTTPPAICSCGNESFAERSQFQSGYSEEAFLAAIKDAGFSSINEASEWASTATKSKLDALGELLLALMKS